MPQIWPSILPVSQRQPSLHPFYCPKHSPSLFLHPIFVPPCPQHSPLFSLCPNPGPSPLCPLHSPPFTLCPQTQPSIHPIPQIWPSILPCPTYGPLSTLCPETQTSMIPVPHTQPFFHSMTQTQPFTLPVPQPWPSILSVPQTQPCRLPPPLPRHLLGTPYHPQTSPCPPTPPNSADVPLITSVPESPPTPAPKFSFSASQACPSSSPTPQHPLSSASSPPSPKLCGQEALGTPGPRMWLFRPRWLPLGLVLLTTPGSPQGHRRGSAQPGLPGVSPSPGVGVKIPPNLSPSVVLCRSHGLGSLPKPTFVPGRGSSSTRCPHRRHGTAPPTPPSLFSQAAAASWRCAQLLANPALGKSFCFQCRGAPLPPEVFTSLGSFRSDGRDGVQEGGELIAQRPGWEMVSASCAGMRAGEPGPTRTRTSSQPHRDGVNQSSGAPRAAPGAGERAGSTGRGSNISERRKHRSAKGAAPVAVTAVPFPDGAAAGSSVSPLTERL